VTEDEARRPRGGRLSSRPSQHLPPSPTRVAFSLFEGDLVNRIFSYFGIHGRRAVDLIARILILMSVTWGVLAVLAVFVSKVAQGPAGENFFLDFAAYLQLIIGLPLFVIAERVIGEHTREAAGYFLAAGVIPPEEIPTIEHAPWSLHTVWAPLVFFVIGAPLVFTLPLFMFTKQLYRVKKRAREELYERMGDRARIFEDRWRKVEPSVSFNAELLQWHQLRTLYEHVEKMRIVPFDLRSFAELLVQTLGALVPLLGYLNLPEPVLNVLEHGTKMLH